MDVVHRVNAVIALDSDGKRLFTKYYCKAFAGKLEKQQGFEKRLHEKTRVKDPTALRRTQEVAEITVFEALTVVFRIDTEVSLYVVGSLEENEVVLSHVLECLYDTILQLLKCSQGIEKRALLENYDLLLLTVDETIDSGVILQLNGGEVYALVSEHAEQGGDAANVKKLKNLKEVLFKK